MRPLTSCSSPAVRLPLRAEPDKPADPAGRVAYELRKEHDPDGIGKFYMGREIAQVMGHEAAGWLERPEREKEEQPTKLMEALKLKPGDVVADVGAGSGYFTFRIAEVVGDKGKVLAVDIQPEMLDIIRKKHEGQEDRPTSSRFWAPITTRNCRRRASI